MDLNNFPFIINPNTLIFVRTSEHLKYLSYSSGFNQVFHIEEESQFNAEYNFPLDYAEYKVEGTMYDFRVGN